MERSCECRRQIMSGTRYEVPSVPWRALKRKHLDVLGEDGVSFHTRLEQGGAPHRSPLFLRREGFPQIEKVGTDQRAIGDQLG
ncbi:hypothetical protein TNCT_323621 [Trichonephila clavata]|uniref:Uncharacterized protein n=1 Tax=Trichonephila clavata TaxID=2740835 RepID=A0A8X6F0D2_TRICU|nr:hypothetical protein TNCT_323621 [Trichonephila clavata]